MEKEIYGKVREIASSQTVILGTITLLWYASATAYIHGYLAPLGMSAADIGFDPFWLLRSTFAPVAVAVVVALIVRVASDSKWLRQKWWPVLAALLVGSILFCEYVAWSATRSLGLPVAWLFGVVGVLFWVFTVNSIVQLPIIVLLYPLLGRTPVSKKLDRVYDLETARATRLRRRLDRIRVSVAEIERDPRAEDRQKVRLIRQDLSQLSRDLDNTKWWSKRILYGLRGTTIVFFVITLLVVSARLGTWASLERLSRAPDGEVVLLGGAADYVLVEKQEGDIVRIQRRER